MLYSTAYGTERGCRQLLPATAVTRPQLNTHPLSDHVYSFTYCITTGHHMQLSQQHHIHNVLKHVQASRITANTKKKKNWR